MPNAWNGGDPIEAVDFDDYELGTYFVANVDVTLTHARIWTGVGEIDTPARRARVWTAGGAQLGIAVLPDNLAPGWTTHAYTVPVQISAGTPFIVSYSTGGNEGALPAALVGSVVSADGAVTALAAGSTPIGNGMFNLTPGAFPNVGSGTQAFYGSDVVYDVGFPTVSAPVIAAIDITQVGTTVTVNVTATDAETLVGAAYRFNWGDGSADTVTAFPTVSANHVYTVTGTYAILITVTDADGNIDYQAVVVDIVVMGAKPLTFWTIPQLLVEEISDALAPTLGGRPERACVVPGAIAWDGCSCGALYVSTNKWFLSESFPQNAQGADTRTTPCEMPWLVGEIVIQIMRCAHSPQGREIDVPCNLLSDSAKIVASDAYVTLTTALRVMCGLKNDDIIIDFSFGEQPTQGPEGGCVGSELRVFVAVPR